MTTPVPAAERMRRLRQRRRDGLRAAPERRPPEMAEAVERMLTALALPPGNEAAAALVRRYAEQLDQARDPGYAARWIGPLLLAALESLGGTPAARSRMRGQQPKGRRRGYWDGVE